MSVRANSWNTALIVSWKEREHIYFKQNQVKVGNCHLSVEIVHNELSSSRTEGFLTVFLMLVLLKGCVFTVVDSTV